MTSVLAPQTDLDGVFAIDGEGVFDDCAAAGAEREAFDVLILRKVGADAIGARRAGLTVEAPSTPELPGRLRSPRSAPTSGS